MLTCLHRNTVYFYRISTVPFQFQGTSAVFQTVIHLLLKRCKTASWQYKGVLHYAGNIEHIMRCYQPEIGVVAKMDSFPGPVAWMILSATFVVLVIIMTFAVVLIIEYPFMMVSTFNLTCKQGKTYLNEF